MQKSENFHLNNLSLSPSGWFRSLEWGVSHTGSPSPLGSILHVHQVEPQILHVVLHDVDPPFSLSSPTPLSTYVCLQDSRDTILLFSALYMPKPSQPGLPYLVRDAHYSEDVTDIVIPFLSLNVKPRIHLSILISVLSKRSPSRLFNVHASEP